MTCAIWLNPDLHPLDLCLYCDVFTVITSSLIWGGADYLYSLYSVQSFNKIIVSHFHNKFSNVKSV